LGPHSENDGWYIVWPLIGFLVIAVVSHVALLVFEKNRFAYFAYALVHVPVFLATYVLALIFATHFPL
jgi:hypothetical protein